MKNFILSRKGGLPMKCPYCGFEDTKVVDSRLIGGKKRRRRRCTNCDKRFTTYESVEIPDLLVNKKDNTYEPFDRNKLIRGLSFAVKKRIFILERNICVWNQKFLFHVSLLDWLLLLCRQVKVL